jgi:hypothetical protein
VKTAEGPQVGVLRRVFGQTRIAEDAFRDGVCHGLSPLHETAEGLEVSGLRANDEIVDEVHVTLLPLTGKTPARQECDAAGPLCLLDDDGADHAGVNRAVVRKRAPGRERDAARAVRRNASRVEQT